MTNSCQRSKLRYEISLSPCRLMSCQIVSRHFVCHNVRNLDRRLSRLPCPTRSNSSSTHRQRRVRAQTDAEGIHRTCQKSESLATHARLALDVGTLDGADLRTIPMTIALTAMMVDGHLPADRVPLGHRYQRTRMLTSVSGGAGRALGVTGRVPGLWTASARSEVTF
ncbi:hypothetical protein BC826DRAFT_359918 [Russula brevipes]|nr:hypothetical protein BC826DRAFT_359918 [Russula brevipes]